MRIVLLLAVFALALASPAAAAPGDGEWVLMWKVVGKGARANEVPWCNPHEEGAARVVVVDGQAAGELTSSAGNPLTFEVVIGDDGKGTLSLDYHSGKRKPLEVPIRMKKNGFKRKIAKGRQCEADVRMVRP